MKNLSKVIAVIGVLVAFAAAISNPENFPTLVEFFGENAAAKVAAIGATIAGLGGSILGFFTSKPTNANQ